MNKTATQQIQVTCKISLLGMDSYNHIPGFYYLPNYITEYEEKVILDMIQTSTDWNPVGIGADSRRVLQFGYRYAYDRSGLSKTVPIPDSFLSLVHRERITTAIGRNLLAATKEFDQLIINAYKPGQGIAAHIDHPTLFGGVIVCISLGSAVEIEFSKGTETQTVYIAARSLYVLSGDARYRYKHGIRRKKTDQCGQSLRQMRYSCTYRTIADKLTLDHAKANDQVDQTQGQ